jgi:hypothetical protein
LVASASGYTTEGRAGLSFSAVGIIERQETLDGDDGRDSRQKDNTRRHAGSTARVKGQEPPHEEGAATRPPNLCYSKLPGLLVTPITLRVDDALKAEC